MDVLLVMFRDGGDPRPFPLSKEATVIGRREDCDLRIAVGDVSRKHCRLLLDDGALRVDDLGSSNGTFVNGSRVRSATLTAGDTLQVGPVAFVVQIDGEPSLADARPQLRAPASGESGVGSGLGTSATLAGAGVASSAASKRPAKSSDGDEIDELEILNQSGDSHAGGDDLFDLGPAKT